MGVRGTQGRKGGPDTGEYWRCTLVETDTRLRAGRGLAKTETEASIEALEMLKRRAHPQGPPPLVSDGWGGHREALVEVWGQAPKYRGRGRPPVLRRPRPGWRYLQLVKQRDEHGRVLGVEPKVVYGRKEAVLEQLGLGTVYVERTHLTSRHMNGRLTRKTLGYSKRLQMLAASCVWEDVVYNVARPVRTLRVASDEGGHRWRHRTPTMAAGITDHIWSIEELLTALPVPNNT